MLLRPPAAISRAFGTSLFCFAKNQCTHNFSVLSPDQQCQKHQKVIAAETKTKGKEKENQGDKVSMGEKILAKQIN